MGQQMFEQGQAWEEGVGWLLTSGSSGPSQSTIFSGLPCGPKSRSSLSGSHAAIVLLSTMASSLVSLMMSFFSKSKSGVGRPCRAMCRDLSSLMYRSQYVGSFSSGYWNTAPPVARRQQCPKKESRMRSEGMVDGSGCFCGVFLSSLVPCTFKALGKAILSDDGINELLFTREHKEAIWEFLLFLFHRPATRCSHSLGKADISWTFSKVRRPLQLSEFGMASRFRAMLMLASPSA